MPIKKTEEKKLFTGEIINFEIEIDGLSSPLPPETTDELDALDINELLSLIDISETQPSFSYKKVKKAGRALRKQEGDLKVATKVLQSFRAEHKQALDTVAYIIARCCRQHNTHTTAVKRLKRLETIVNKLQRPSLDGTMNNQTCVSRMNDIAGCRFIFPDLNSLRVIEDTLFQLNSNQNRIYQANIYDYIAKPKDSDCGYRCLHIVYKYSSKNGHQYRVEAQLRTNLQHAWATTVEIVDIIEKTEIKTKSFYDNSLKTTLQKNWEALLRLMSDYIAFKEGALPLEQPALTDISTQLNLLNKQLNALKKLESFNMISEQKSIEDQSEKHSQYIILLVNDLKKEVQKVMHFTSKQEAILNYNTLEKIYERFEGANILLVSTKDVTNLAKAYPNYIGNCSVFVGLLKEALTNI